MHLGCSFFVSDPTAAMFIRIKKHNLKNMFVFFPPKYLNLIWNLIVSLTYRLQQLAPLPDITLQVKPALLQQASELLSKPKISDFSYNLHHNDERACNETDILFMIPSFPENFKRRETVRQSDFYRSAEIQGVATKVVFFFYR